uniref:Uncharacterized protein n=1 Tax=viral metagenome TaxID=1070528 RepID=A0A6C0EAC1_9ZZZZ
MSNTDKSSWILNIRDDRYIISNCSDRLILEFKNIDYNAIENMLKLVDENINFDCCILKEKYCEYIDPFYHDDSNNDSDYDPAV